MDRIPMAESIGIGWRLESESGGGMNRIRVAACAGIRNCSAVSFWLHETCRQVSKGVLLVKGSTKQTDRHVESIID